MPKVAACRTGKRFWLALERAMRTWTTGGTIAVAGTNHLEPVNPKHTINGPVVRFCRAHGPRSAVPRQQLLTRKGRNPIRTNPMTIHTVHNRPKSALFYPHLGKPTPEIAAPNLTFPPHLRPQPITQPPHPHIVPAASLPPLMASPQIPSAPKNALLPIDVTRSTITTYKHPPAIPAHHTPECQHTTPKQNT